VLGYLLALAIGGLVIGAFARLALPGKDPLTILQTMLVGIGGSFAAGLLVRLFFGPHYTAGFLASLVCATAIVYVIRRSRGGSLTTPAPPTRPPELRR
jgi:uncharacterized membrane protein YeaQ/YmgE (transglycosylase-associated protein family)